MHISPPVLPENGKSELPEQYSINKNTGSTERFTLINYKNITPETIKVLNTPFSPRGISENIAQYLATQTQKNRLRVHCYAPPDTPAYVTGDSNLIEQILLRLADNALKHTLKGEIYIGCEIAEMHGEAALTIMRFEVRDTGTGIRIEKLKELTASDSKCPEDNKVCRPQPKGQDLNIVEKLAQLMGGHLYIESAYTLGSRFWFEIPLNIPNNPDIDINTARQAPDYLDGRYVLIITQSETSQFILKNYLKAWNTRPIVATGQDEAMLMLRNSLALNEPFYAIIIDLDDPEENQASIDIIRSKRRHDSVPIIVLNAKNAAYNHITASIPAPVIYQQLYRLLNHDIRQLQDQRAMPFSVKSQQIKILLVENNRLDAIITTAILDNLDADIDHISDETQLIRQIIDNTYHLILINIPIVEKDFYNTHIIQTVRSWEEHTVQERLPIIVLAPYMPGIKPAEYLKKAGASDYIAKPIRKDEMLEIAGKWLPQPESSRAGNHISAPVSE